MNTPGRYRGRLLSHSLGQNENTKNYQLAFAFELVGKYNGQGQLEPCDPQTRTVWRVLTDKTAERIGQEIAALGFTGSSFAQLDKDQSGDDFIDLAGVEADLTMRNEPYNGQNRDRWELAVLGGTGASAGAPVERKQVRDIDNKFGKFLKAAVKSAGPNAAKPKPEPAMAGAGAAASDDADVPF